MYVAGEGDRAKAEVMFIAPALLEEEAREEIPSTTGKIIKQTPRYMLGPAGAIFKDVMASQGVDPDECGYYTAMCKWLLPRNVRTKPKREHIDWGMPALEAEIFDIKPAIIVCLGKPVFDQLVDVKLSLKDARGAWFWSDKYKARIYLMDDVTKPVTKPEFVEKFRVDAVNINRMLRSVRGVNVATIEQHYLTIRNKKELQDLVNTWSEGNYTIFSVDCEWAGMTHVDGSLRSLQVAWAPGHAAYIRFMDENMDYVFDCSYKEAGAILGEVLNKPQCKYVGHHISADFPWMYTKLGLDYYEKCIFDTEFGQQCVNEYDNLSLEYLALKYTDLGRYDIDLILWKKKNKLAADEGYGRIPDDIIIPYGCKDVDTVIRSYPKILSNMIQQGLAGYYQNILLPFVSDVFTEFALVGLPMDTAMMDDLRDLYSFARDAMNADLRRSISAEAKMLLIQKLMTCTDDPSKVVALFDSVEAQVREFQEMDKAWTSIKQFCGASKVLEVKPFFDHYVDAPSFNIRSPAHMRRWLFDVKGFEPIKSTNNKDKGLPSISWDRVRDLPPKAQKEYTPSTDKQTLTILSEQDAMVGKLLRLNAVGNICKAFLKEADKDEEGNVTKENGLHFWLASDGRVHGQMSTTETGRPRSWKPNSLNWPSYVNDSIKDGIQECFARLASDGLLPDEYLKYLKEKPPSIRSCVRAPEGWCFVESDYQTAEIRGLAFISGDQNLIDLVTKPDKKFGLLPPDAEGKMKPIRLEFDGCIAEQFRDPGLLASLDDPRLQRHSDGSLMHPKADLHWSLAEMVHNKPREILDDKRDRGAAKVGNFSSAYGASPGTLERKIEADTGKKPDAGTGQKLLDALAARQPEAEAFLQAMELVPDNPGYYRAASGRLRHFVSHNSSVSISGRQRKGLLSSMGREARNFPMQESVAATAARAGKWLLDAYIREGLEARPMIILYDSVVTLCPLEERFRVSELHQEYMTEKNVWTYHGIEMNYPIDNEFVLRWSTKPNAEDKALLGDRSYRCN